MHSKNDLLQNDYANIIINLLPFHIDVTHVFSCDAGFIQDDFSCIPNDGSQ